MIPAIIKEMIAAIPEEPADTSLIKPIFSWYSGWIKSASFSIPVFKWFGNRTKPIAKVCKIHSVELIWK